MTTTFECARSAPKSEKPVRPPAPRAEAARKLAQAHNDALSSNPHFKEAKPGQGFVLVGAKRSTLDT